jgi:4-hydroxy-3-polyprenylbenzoate decarboxylase
MDLRDYMEILNERGELHIIDKEVHWNLEAAALGAMNNRVEGPVILCRNIKGYPKGYSLLIDPFHGTFEKPYRLVALACGMEPDIPIDEFTSELAKRVETPIKPIIVNSGTCKENILLGKDVDLYQFPWPYIHYGDGGRYSTLQSWVCKDPESDWVNWANYRTIIHSKTAMGVNPTPGGHLYIIHGRNEKKDLPTPFCVTYGGDMACVMAAAFAVPYGVSEVNIAGGIRQEPIELIKAETNDLYVPADAEIVVEGELLASVRWDEGPFGEFAGFMHGPRVPRPVLKVCKPVMPGASP